LKNQQFQGPIQTHVNFFGKPHRQHGAIFNSSLDVFRNESVPRQSLDIFRNEPVPRHSGAAQHERGNRKQCQHARMFCSENVSVEIDTFSRFRWPKVV